MNSSCRNPCRLKRCATYVQVYPHGSTDALPFVTMGSGSLNAMSVFESGYQDDMSKEQAMELVGRAIKAGIYNDLGSGSNVDLCIITKGGAEYLRNYEVLTERTYQRQNPVIFKPGTARMYLLMNTVSLPMPWVWCAIADGHHAEVASGMP